MDKFYGGAVPNGMVDVLCPSRGNTARPATAITGRRDKTPREADPSHASTYTPEEAAFAEAYAREAMADSAPTTDRHFNEYGWA